jgi:hypothetical protein
MLRATALVAVAALALHELRYLIGYGGGTPEALASQGHSYLPVVSGLAGVLLALALAQLAARVLRGSGERNPRGFRSAWALASVALLAIFVGQESLEGLLSSGHPAGVAAVTAHGGLVAVPLALALGGLVALGLRSASRLVAGAARRRLPLPSRPRLVQRRPDLRVPRPRAGVLALNLAGRAPPARL